MFGTPPRRSPHPLASPRSYGRTAFVALCCAALLTACGSEKKEASPSPTPPASPSGTSSPSTSASQESPSAQSSGPADATAASGNKGVPDTPMRKLTAQDLPAVVAALKSGSGFEADLAVSNSMSKGTINKSRALVTWTDGQWRVATLGADAPAGGTWQDANMMILGTDLYLHAPSPVNGMSWMRVDTTDPALAMDPVVFGSRMVSPVGAVESLLKAKDFKFVESKPVAGQPANHYRLTVTPEAFGESLGAPAVVQMLDGPLTVGLWVGAGDLPLQLEQKATYRAQGGPDSKEKGPTNTMLIRYRDFGSPITIGTPPEAETTTPPDPSQAPASPAQ